VALRGMPRRSRASRARARLEFFAAAGAAFRAVPALACRCAAAGAKMSGKM
jgi:hypothetical protein